MSATLQEFQDHSAKGWWVSVFMMPPPCKHMFHVHLAAPGWSKQPIGDKSMVHEFYGNDLNAVLKEAMEILGPPEKR